MFSTIKGAGQKIKDTVRENSLSFSFIFFFIFSFSFHFHQPNLLSEFQKEQNLFLKARSSVGGAAVAPWVGHVKEEALKEEILGLSAVRVIEFLQGPFNNGNLTSGPPQLCPLAPTNGKFPLELRGDASSCKGDPERRPEPGKDAI